MKFRFTSAVALFSYLTAAVAFGASGEQAHILSAAGGIASPSSTLALSENPSGLTTNQNTKFLGTLISGNSNFSTLGWGGFLYFGNGTSGAAIGAETTSGGGSGFGEIVIVDFGGATMINALNMSFGAAGGFVASSGGGGSNIGLNLGATFNPKGKTRVGVVAFSVLDGVNAYGAGIATDLSGDATFALDGAVDADGSGSSIEPGIVFHISNINLSIGLGIETSGGGSVLGEGLDAGLGVPLSNNLQLQAYYHHIGEYFFGLSFRL